MRHWEIQELAGAAMGWTEEQTKELINGDEDFDTPLLETLGVDFQQFSKVAEALLKLTPVVTSQVSDSREHAFVKQVEGGYIAIIKAPAN